MIAYFCQSSCFLSISLCESLCINKQISTQISHYFHYSVLHASCCSVEINRVRQIWEYKAMGKKSIRKSRSLSTRTPHLLSTKKTYIGCTSFSCRLLLLSQKFSRASTGKEGYGLFLSRSHWKPFLEPTLSRSPCPGLSFADTRPNATDVVMGLTHRRHEASTKREVAICPSLPCMSSKKWKCDAL